VDRVVADGGAEGGVDAEAALAVVPAGALAPGGVLLPMAGAWERPADGPAAFTPAFPPVAGSTYVLLWRGDGTGAWVPLARATAPGTPAPRTTRVLAVEPDVEEVPENLLRFSLLFSAPVDEGGAGAHVDLRTADGAPLPGALLPMPPELWDRPRRRLTVLLDPGRVKRGLQPHVQAGPPLPRGTDVTLSVGEDVRDAAGARLAAGAARTYRVGPPVRARVDPARWALSWPATPGDELAVTFGRPLERTLVQRCLRAVDADGRAVPGAAVASAAAWRFTPTPGAPAVRCLHVHPDLEDLAGNSVRHVFDRDLAEPADDPVATAGVVLHPDGRVVVRPPAEPSAGPAPDDGRARVLPPG